MARVEGLTSEPHRAPYVTPGAPAGQERFGSMTRVYYKEAVAAFVVFDVTRSVTFDAVMKWKNDLDQKVQLANGDCVPCVLLANKVRERLGRDQCCRDRECSESSPISANTARVGTIPTCLTQSGTFL